MSCLNPGGNQASVPWSPLHRSPLHRIPHTRSWLGRGSRDLGPYLGPQLSWPEGPSMQKSWALKEIQMTHVSGLTPGGGCHGGIPGRQHNQRMDGGLGWHGLHVLPPARGRSRPGLGTCHLAGREGVVPPHAVTALTLRVTGHSLPLDPGQLAGTVPAEPLGLLEALRQAVLGPV